jgi:hypothetical protein
MLSRRDSGTVPRESCEQAAFCAKTGVGGRVCLGQGMESRHPPLNAPADGFALPLRYSPTLISELARQPRPGFAPVRRSGSGPGRTLNPGTELKSVRPTSEAPVSEFGKSEAVLPRGNRGGIERGWIRDWLESERWKRAEGDDDGSSTHCKEHSGSRLCNPTPPAATRRFCPG